ncbi:MAG: RNA polymerase sigma factor [Anaerolineales bacterium]
MSTTTKNPEEAIWLQQALAGDDEAFGRIVEAFQGPVYNLCYRMLEQPTEAEDAAQETFMKAYRNLGSYDPRRKFINWILAIASNHCVDRLRKRRLSLVSLQEIKPWRALAAEIEAPESSLVDLEQEQEIQQLLGELSGTDRAAILLRYWYDLSYAEIAATLSLTESAVKSRLHRARNQLAESWTAGHSIGPVFEGRRDGAPTVS